MKILFKVGIKSEIEFTTKLSNRIESNGVELFWFDSIRPG